jgi:tRNA uridine 5-carboxymethylaminomethyl modification enzyme
VTGPRARNATLPPVRHSYDVIVIGGGHAGIEAAAAAARLGCRTAMVSGNLDTIGKMSCNPSIGGLAKGQLAREIDALGGLMARATDATGIHFRTLARSKGPALWSPRAQCDKAAYSAWMKREVENTPNLFVVQGEAWDLLLDDVQHLRGVALRDGRELLATRVVVTTGTFLRGLMHQGESQSPGGRMGDGASQGLSNSFTRFGLRLIRHKTGTPCRIHADSIDLAHCTVQPGDDPPPLFSFLSTAPILRQISCWSARTTSASHDIIRANLHRAPMYNGQIESIGPRYCPSIEDKVMRFADKDQHHLFLEPEGLDTKEVYVNGLSTSLPIDVQDAVLAAIPALANAHVLRYGYAVEYDVVAPDQIDHRLECRTVAGLHFAGQINGTSGYEEAAAQGLIAGANAALALLGREPLMISRADGYIGVLIDDLVTRLPEEPYRMFTSRAEHRLHLRSDNADRRLTPIAGRLGLVGAERTDYVARLDHAVTALTDSIAEEVARRIAGEGLEFTEATALVPALASAEPRIAEQVWIDLRYRAYLNKQHDRIRKLTRLRDLPLLHDLDLATLPGLSHEGRQVLMRRRPQTLGECTSLSGVTAADVETLWSHLQIRLRPPPRVRT